MSTLVWQSLGWALLHLLWQGTLVAVALAVALQVVDRRAASLRYLLACGALALMLVLPVLTGWHHVLTHPRTGSAPEAAALASPSEPRPLPSPAPAASGPEAAGDTGFAFMVERARSGVSGNLHALVLAWGLGVVLSSLRLLSGWLRLRQLVREAEPAPVEWQESLERLARHLGMTRPMRLLCSAEIDVPATLGWLRPVVLLPVTVLTGLSARQLEMVLAHELAHIRRHDFAVNLVQTLVETLLFYHPAVWWMSRVIRAERENCCDDIAVGTSGNAVSYARALTALESLRELPVSGPAMSALGGSLTARVRRLVGRPATRCASRWEAGALLLTLMSGLAVAAPLVALALPAAPPLQTRASPPLKVALAVAPAPAPAPAQPLAPGSVPIPVPQPSAPAESAGKPAPKAQAKEPLRLGLKEPLTVDQLVELKTAGVSMEQKRQWEALGYAPTVEELVQLGHANATPEYMKEMTDALGNKPTLGELAQMRFLGVSARKVKALAAAGHRALSVDQVKQAAALGMDEDFLQEMREAGQGSLTFDQLIQFRALGVKGKYMQALKELGYDKLSADELVQFKALDVSPGYLRGLREAGLDKLDPEAVVKLRALGVDASDLRKLRDEGLDKLSVDELIRLRSSGVDADFIRELRKEP
ncbi:Regulatory sensor-transducer, BlaR1/MecR1 family [Cystobacter fuscus DSM 2262]|uniref:Regulatory sensor-transducer, BlaR1/MecR1 family n=1 Tax=Cystobacter fuscus (strain ATCC 25194 / DSM 2262 / NBRC 100088 / M29) TaxID=1242864 RepID=S9PKE5_CYSF2|nr:M56 family metallopeptidase [Cystobacter fuscus]EPX62927.1 Regulatory sensor-transducer, BlaR1/MecR1 family [Cystobacter fuscus DSM 2262]